MKKLVFFILLMLSFSLFAQEAEKGEDNFSMGGAAGSVTINGETFSQIRLMPELTFGKIGVGLDVNLLIDSEGNIREKDWDDWEDYVNKIYYIRYGNRGDSIFGKIGGFPSYTLGHGLLMNSYSNMLKYPDFKQIGLQIGGKIPVMDSEIELFTSDILENKIVAGSFYIKPIKELGLPIISNLKVGIQVAADLDQYSGLTSEQIAQIPIDTDGDGVYDEFDVNADGDNLIDLDYLLNHGLTMEEIEAMGIAYDDSVYFASLELDEKELVEIGLGYDLPLITQKLFTLGHYGEAAQILDHGTGFIFPGFYSKFLMFDMNLEFRHFGDEFVPGYFDQLYDANRAYVSQTAGIHEIKIKESILDSVKASNGWYGSITSNIFNTVYLKVAYQDMYGDDVDNGKSIWGSIWLKENMIPKLATARISYSQTGEETILEDFRTPTSMIEGKVALALSPNAQLVYSYQERYVDYNGDNEIKAEDDEIIKSVNMGVEFKF